MGSFDYVVRLRKVRGQRQVKICRIEQGGTPVSRRFFNVLQSTSTSYKYEETAIAPIVGDQNRFSRRPSGVDAPLR
jgi:hypothetical protein